MPDQLFWLDVFKFLLLFLRLLRVMLPQLQWWVQRRSAAGSCDPACDCVRTRVQVSMYTLESLARHLPAVLPASWAPRPLRRLRIGAPPPAPLPWPDTSNQVGVVI